MTDTSASALVWFSGILIFFGWLVMSPSGAFFLFVLSALFAVVPAVFGATKMRLAAFVLLIMAIFFATARYPEFKSERERLGRRHKIGFQQMHKDLTPYLGLQIFLEGENHES